MAIVNIMRVNGRALRAIRLDQQASLRAVAAAAGISAPYLSRLERDLRGHTGVSDATITALAAALGMPIEAICSSARRAA